MPPDPRRRWPPVVAVAAAACLLTLYMAWPVLRAPARRLFGTELVGRFHDPYTVMRIFDAPIASLSLYTQPLTDWIGALFAKLFDAVTAYNIVVLATFPLAALAVFGLARFLGCRPGGAAVAALAFAFAPAHLAHAAYHPHVAQVQWIPLYLWAVWAACRRPAVGTWSLAAITLAAMGLANFYFGWFGLVLLPVVALAAPQPRRRRLRTAGVLAACAVVCGLLALTPVWRGFAQAHGFSLADAERYAARPEAYLLPAVDHVALGGLARAHWSPLRLGDALLEQQQGVSWALIALSLVAVAAWWRRRGDPALRWLPALMVTGAAAFLFSLPPRLSIGGGSLWLPGALLHWAAPMFRAQARFGFFVQLAICLAAAIGLERLWRGGMKTRALACALVVVAAFEYLPAPPWRWRPLLPTTAHRALAAMPSTATVLDCVTPPHAVASVSRFVPPDLRAAHPDRLDCGEPELAPKLAALGVAHVIRTADAAPVPGLALQRRAADSTLWRVDATPAAVYVSRLSGFSWREPSADGSYRWMGPRGTLALTVAPGPARAFVWRARLMAFPGARRVTVRLDGDEIARLRVHPEPRWFALGPLHLEPGAHTLELIPEEPPAVPDEILGNGDTRPLTIALASWSWSTERELLPDP